MIQEIEKALLKKLEELLKPTGFAILPFPEAPEHYVMTHPKGAVLVRNSGSAYGAPDRTDMPLQQRTLSFELGVLVKNLRSHEGAYGVIDALAFGLIGWKAPNAIFGARLEREGFARYDAGVWYWALTIAVPMYLGPSAPEVAAAFITRLDIETDTETLTAQGDTDG